MTRLQKLRSTPQLTSAALAGIGLAALMAGCGGGGSSVASRTGANTGALSPNTIFYSTSPDGGYTMVLNQVNPDGTGQNMIGTLPIGYQGISMNPAMIGMKVFGYSPSGAAPAKYGIYQNSTISGSGATMLVPPTYSFIEAMQVSFDGRWVYYVAPIGNGDPALYKVPITGGQPTVLDNNGFIFSANVDSATGTRVTYDKQITNSQGNQVSAIFMLPTSGNASPTMLANDPAHNYEFPQFSKDGQQIVFESDIDNSSFDIYTMSAAGGSVSGSNLTRVTNLLGVAKEDGVSFSADGTSAAFIGDNANASQTGVYRTGTIGVSPPANCSIIVQDSTIQSGLYWTSFGGRGQTGSMGYLAKRRHAGLTP